MPLSADTEEAHPPPYKILSSPLLSPPSHHHLLLEPSTRVAALATTAGAAAVSLTNYATTHRIHVYAHLGSPLHDAYNNPTPPRHPTTIATDCSLHHLHHDRDGFEGPDGPPIATLKRRRAQECALKTGKYMAVHDTAMMLNPTRVPQDPNDHPPACLKIPGDSAGLFVAPGTSTRLTAGKPTALQATTLASRDLLVPACGPRVGALSGDRASLSSSSLAGGSGTIVRVALDATRRWPDATTLPPLRTRHRWAGTSSAHWAPRIDAKPVTSTVVRSARWRLHT
ncbi:hypothetical protein C8Q79DRAFT_1004442 [Trametes meyenii]|nr:hypothetical protein C8Q79DRAFT_1004442 [Trametes meyenii]